MPRLLAPFLPHIGIALALLGAIWWIHHQGYAQARRDAEARDLQLRNQLQANLRTVEQALSDRIAAIDAQAATTRGGIAQTRTIVQPVIERELTRETRYSDPALGISDSLRAAIDRARAAVACAATADGGIICTLPATGASQGQ